MLYVVATPIGNLEDITIRALSILKNVDMIAAEDTRHTLGLLNHFDIKKPLISYFEHNKVKRGEYLLELLKEGKDIALVSDAGTPGISDPGADLIKLAIENDIEVTMAPGPTAAIMALVLSGLDTGKFVFEGFLPANKKERKQVIAGLINEQRTTVIYEAPHRIGATLEELYKELGDRNIAVVKELTKKFEKATRCRLSEAAEVYKGEAQKGEFVIVLQGAAHVGEEAKGEWENISVEEHINIYLNRGMQKKDAIKQVAKERGLNKREVYKITIPTMQNINETSENTATTLFSLQPESSK